MKTLGVIPSRIGSTRFPEKPLARILDKPLLQWVIEGAKKSQCIDKLMVATDDERIAQLAETCGIEAVFTNSDLPTGTDRIYQASKDLNYDLILNIQGDEPLIRGDVLDLLVSEMKKDSQAQMGTLSHEIETEEDLKNENIVKVLSNQSNHAIYFSRFPIPFSRGHFQKNICQQHIGIYAYRKEFLNNFCNQPVTNLEKAESLEQLRALSMGAKIKIIKTHYKTYGVDVPDDILKIENILKGQL